MSTVEDSDVVDRRHELYIPSFLGFFFVAELSFLIAQRDEALIINYSRLLAAINNVRYMDVLFVNTSFLF